jgi:asparagine synthase (glutamine-hydrolysing)
MCGIAGFILAGWRDDAEACLKSMGRRIEHRGPDGEGFFLESTDGGKYTVGLAHRRLAILDLVSGDQPMVHQAAGVTLIFNGEIYNFADLRQELEQLGHRFLTRSDTEVLLHSYVEWGPECVRRLSGMFAFALWDHPRCRLVLARDHFGEKPLFVYQDDRKLLFGSEIKALLAFGDVQTSLDRASVADFLVYRYVPGPHTLFTGVHKIMPGSYAVWEDGHLTERRFYKPPYGEDRNIEGSPISEPVSAFRDALDEAVRLRMVCDVPYGAFLSGGIDSSSIVALMSRYSSGPIKTFSVGFSEQSYSELPYANLVARQFETQHSELVVSSGDLMQLLPFLIRQGDGPVSEASNIPIYLISREAAKSVKMVLTGEGADELLGGYPKHSAERFVSLYQSAVPSAVHGTIVEPLVRQLPYKYRRVKILAETVGIRNRAERMPRWFGALTFRERDQLLKPDIARRPPESYPFRQARHRSALESMLHFDQTSWLPDNLLERGDRLTMAASIEARMPFMDKGLAALAAQLPDKWRIHGFTQKYILRESMRGLLPAEILARPKVGFRVPINEWFRSSMRSYVRDYLTRPGSLIGELCGPHEVEQILTSHESGRQNHEKLIWPLMNLEIFHEEYRLAS